jgi:hypothetical protein
MDATSRSSLFVNQEAGQVIKKTWDALIHTGMFGAIRGLMFQCGVEPTSVPASRRCDQNRQ